MTCLRHFGKNCLTDRHFNQQGFFIEIKLFGDIISQKMIGCSVLLGRNILLVNRVPANQIVRGSHSPGGIPGEVFRNLIKKLFTMDYITINIIICRISHSNLRTSIVSLLGLLFSLDQDWHCRSWFSDTNWRNNKCRSNILM